MLSIPGKAFCYILLDRLRQEVDTLLREEQAGFRSGRSCSEQILTLRNIIEQTLEFRGSMYLNFVDFRKAFDSIHRDSLWKICRIYGVPEKFVNIFQKLYENSSSCVNTSIGKTEFFNVYSGVRQGCVLSPFLFLIVVDFVMKKSMDANNIGIPWEDGILTDLDFADDIVLLGRNHDSIQTMTTNLQENGKKVGLRINVAKTKTMTIGRNPDHPVRIEEMDVENVNSFVYLGSEIADNGEADVDVQSRLNKARGVFNRLTPIWRVNTIREEIKLRLYSSIVIPTAIYGCDTWRRTVKIEKKLNVFHRKCLRRILRITWMDHITNTELLRRAKQKDLQEIVNERRLKLAGHVMRLPDRRPAKRALKWIPPNLTRGRGRPKKTWRSTLKEDLERANVTLEEAMESAGDRRQWRLLVAQCSQGNGRN